MPLQLEVTSSINSDKHNLSALWQVSPSSDEKFNIYYQPPWGSVPVLPLGEMGRWPTLISYPGTRYWQYLSAQQAVNLGMSPMKVLSSKFY